MITYGKYFPEINRMAVYLDNYKAGDIRAFLNGWHYVPVGQTAGGDLFKDIAGVQASLEAK